MKTFLLALQFLTIITIKSDLKVEGKDLARSTSLYPLVGLIIGLILAGSHWLFLRVWPPGITDLLTIVVLVGITRGLHLDGLADTLDGILSGADREKCLEIMKDSRVGTFGAAGVMIIILAKYLALTTMPSYIKGQVLIVLPAISRFSMVQLAFRSPYARRDQPGLGKQLENAIRPWYVFIAFLSAGAIACIMLGQNGLYSLAVIVIATGIYQAFFKWKLGGITGDVLGCVNEWNEALFLLLLSSLFNS
jgi:adenosylcobinamide-GDP ribazoletransferase